MMTTELVERIAAQGVDSLSPSISGSTDAPKERANIEAAENSAPTFTLSLPQSAGSLSETLFVFEDRTSSHDEVKMRVISLTQNEPCPPDNMETTDNEAENAVSTPNDFLVIADGEQEEGDGEPLFPEGKTASQPDLVTLSCSDCDFTTLKRHAFLTHQVIHARPNANQQYNCPECEYTTPHRYNLKTHLKRHADISELDEAEKFKCDKCNYATMYKHDLMTHAKKHDPEKQYRCLHCDFTSIYRHSLLHHNLSKHQGHRPHSCPHCPYSAARKQDLETHMWRHSKQKRYRCTECDYETPYKMSFKSHVDKHNGVKSFQCSHPDCSFSTTTKANLRAHVGRHTKKLCCEKCNFEAGNARKLSKHKCGDYDEGDVSVVPVVVEGKDGKRESKLEYRCKDCEFTTTNKHSLKRHRERHQPDRQMPEKVLKCEHCDYQTGYKTSLKRHMARHSFIKPFKCGHCDYSAINMSQMHVHIAKHTGIKPFQCSVCSYATANKQHLVTHMSKHSNLRHKCNACSFMTAWKDRMRIHLRAHTEGRVFEHQQRCREPPPAAPVLPRCGESAVPSAERTQSLDMSSEGCRRAAEIGGSGAMTASDGESEQPKGITQGNDAARLQKQVNKGDITEEFILRSQGGEDGTLVIVSDPMRKDLIVLQGTEASDHGLNGDVQTDTQYSMIAEEVTTQSTAEAEESVPAEIPL